MLPKIQHPLFEVTIPSTGKKAKIRPMLVREEKILLIAKQSEEKVDQLIALKQVVNNCLQGEFDIDALPYVDLEWLFLKIREYSVSNIAKVALDDNEDGEHYEFEVDLSKVEYKKEETQNPKIDLGDGIGIVLKQPSAALYTSKEFFEQKDEDAFEFMVMQCIDKIFEGDKIHDTKSVDRKELKEFIENIPSKHYAKIQEFFQKVPTLYYKVEYTNKKGTKREIELKSLDDFFIF